MGDVEQRARDEHVSPWVQLSQEIEAHDQTKAEFEAYKREVSEAVMRYYGGDRAYANSGSLAYLILPEPVDPLLIEARRMLAEDHTNGHFDFMHEGVMLKSGAGHDMIMGGRFDDNYALKRYLAALKRGLTITKEQAGEPA